MYQAIVIDDEKWVVKSLIATIKNQDYFEITTEFYDGLSGLEYIRIHQPALAFVDVRLPGMGGLEILQAAHAEGLSTSSGSRNKKAEENQEVSFGRAAKHFSSSASCFFPQICADDD
ncbi:MAG: response regulator [Blautia faecis]